MSEEVKNDTPLKDLIVDFVGSKLNPENDEVTIEHITEVFSQEFPEFLLKMAEENWINGYTQALNDVDFVKNEMKKHNVTEKHNQEQTQ